MPLSPHHLSIIKNNNFIIIQINPQIIERFECKPINAAHPLTAATRQIEKHLQLLPLTAVSSFMTTNPAVKSFRAIYYYRKHHAVTHSIAHWFIRCHSSRWNHLKAKEKNKWKCIYHNLMKVASQIESNSLRCYNWHDILRTRCDWQKLSTMCISIKQRFNNFWRMLYLSQCPCLKSAYNEAY